MSLINQALRKVQSERTAKASTIGSNQPGASYPYNRGRPNRIGLLIGLSACILILISIVAGLLFALLLQEPKPAVADASTRQPDPDATIRSPANPETTPATAPLHTVAPPETQEKPAEETYQITEPHAPVAEPKQEIVEWLAQSKVFGIRISQNSSKVILNNKAFTTGETVNHDLDLKLLQIDEDVLMFVDVNGTEYTKQL